MSTRSSTTRSRRIRTTTTSSQAAATPTIDTSSYGTTPPGTKVVQLSTTLSGTNNAAMGTTTISGSQETGVWGASRSVSKVEERLMRDDSRDSWFGAVHFNIFWKERMELFDAHSSDRHHSGHSCWCRFTAGTSGCICKAWIDASDRDYLLSF
jgi:hypothetical protein